MTAPLTVMREALMTAVSGIDGTGDYTFDLSGVDQVQYCRGEPPISPMVQLYEYRISSNISTEAFGRYDRVYRIKFTGWVPADTELGHAEAAETLIHDLSLALQDNRDVADIVDGQVIDIVIENAEPCDNELNHERLGSLGWADGDIAVYVLSSGGL